MSDDERLRLITRNPTRCYERGCYRENQILLHLADEPWGGSDLCWSHARAAAESTPLVLTCDCEICTHARPVLDAEPVTWFIRDRLTDREDEAIALIRTVDRAAEAGGAIETLQIAVVALPGGDPRTHARAWDPATELKAISICHQVLYLHRQVPRPGGRRRRDGQPVCSACSAPLPCRTVRVIAKEWEDHPDYDQQWDLHPGEGAT